MEPRQAPRTARSIMEETLVELLERETKLASFASELVDTRAAIKVLEKHLGTAIKSDGPRALPAPRKSPAPPKGETVDRIVGVVKVSLDPLSRDQIADLIGREPGGWLSALLSGMVRGGSLIEVSEGRYGVPQELAAA